MNGYQDHRGNWRTDERSDEEKRIDAIIFLLCIFGAPWLLLTVVLIVLAVVGS